MIRLTITFVMLMVTIIAKAEIGKLFTSDKLSSSMLTTVCQDHYGYLWIGSEYGLNKFDGYRFTKYLSTKGDTTSIPANSVSTIYSSSDGRLWIGLSRGLVRYDYHCDRFVTYRFPDGLQPRVNAVAERGGDLIIGTAGYGLFTLRKGTNHIVREHSFRKSSREDYCSRLFVDDNGRLWRSSHRAEMTCYELDAGYGVRRRTDYQLECGPAVDFILYDKGMVVVCMYGLLQYDSHTSRLSRMPLDMSLLGRASIRAATQDSKGNLLLCTSGNGLLRYSLATGKMEKVESPGDDGIIASANVNDVIEDSNHNIWVSCYNRGLYMLSQGKDAFVSWSFAKHNIKTGSSISSLTQDRHGNIWCSVQNNGVYLFDSKSGNAVKASAPEGTNLVYFDRRGRLWMCTENVLYEADVTKGQYHKKAEFDCWGINAIEDDGGDMLFFSIFGKGLCAYNTQTGSIHVYSMGKPIKGCGALGNDWVKSLFMDSRGILWIGMSEGLSCLNPRTGSFLTYGWQSQLLDCMVSAFAELPGGDIAIGTNTGLYLFERKTHKVCEMPGAAQLNDKDICAIKVDKRGEMWISTSDGVWRYDRQTERLSYYIRGNGLTTNEYRQGVSVQTSDGMICFGTNDGITAFSPDDVRRIGTLMENVFLTRIVIGGRTADCMAGEWDIPYGDNAFSMEFSLLDYRNADNVSFEYRLNGGKWAEVSDGINTIYFNRMIPGIYRLEVRATCSGMYSQVQTYRLNVEGPWYLSTMAYVLYVAVLAAVLTLVFMYYRRRKREELEEAKMQFLINATHDIRSPLTMIMGPLSRLKQMVTSSEALECITTIDRNAQRLLLLVNQILDERKIDKAKMKIHCTETDLVQFVKKHTLLYKYRAEQRSITLRVDARVDKLNVWIDRINFEKVVANLLSNAFKYTPDGGEIVLTISMEGKHAVMTVKDNGNGLDNENMDKLFERFYQGNNARRISSVGTGIGLNLSRAIVTLHGGIIKAANRSDGSAGAVFTVMLPLGCKHLSPDQIEQAEVAVDHDITHKKYPTARHGRVMVVDDDEEISDYIKDELSDTYRVDTFPDGREAQKALLTDHYDLVISDVVMPNMDGVSLLKSIKTNVNTNDIPVILLTSRNDVQDRVEGLKRGADAYISKPFNVQELHAQVDNLIDGVRRLKGRFSGRQQVAGQMAAPEVEGNDDAMLKRVMKVVNENYTDSDFNVEVLCKKVGVSRAQLHRKMKELIGITTSEFLRNIRLEKAVELLKEGKINVTQVAYSVGFNNQTHFSTVFKSHYGVSPTEYVNKLTGENLEK